MLQNRWFVLALLFLVRVTMAFQFQAVAALSPLVMQRFDVALADLGLLIGLYLAPGIVLATPGGAIGARFGDARVVAGGMALMVAGGLLMALGPAWEHQLAGRVLAGTGGVVLNVLMSKMVTDWFAGREIATAMGVFVNSWPVGIAAALLFLPLIAGTIGFTGAMAVVAGLALIGLTLLVLCYRSPPSATPGAAATERLERGTLGAVLLAGAIWGLYNGALGMVFGFAPAMLTERGWTLAAASSATSVVLWLVAVSVPLGGLLADRTGRRDRVLLGSVLGFALLLVLAASNGETLIVFTALGLVAGLAAGPIMSLPAAVLRPGTRAQGMGIFFTLFYVGVVLAPILAGWLAQAMSDPSVPFLLGAAMLVLCCPALLAFRRLEAAEPAPVRAGDRAGGRAG